VDKVILDTKQIFNILFEILAFFYKNKQNNHKQDLGLKNKNS
jgi:hypothetical protein